MIQLSKILPQPQCFSSSLLSSLLRESVKMRDPGNEVAQDGCLLCTYQCQAGGGGGGEGGGI